MDLDTDYLNYFPLKGGFVPPSSIGLEKFSNLPDEQKTIFQIHTDRHVFQTHKEKCRLIGIDNFYQKDETKDISPIVRFICAKLAIEYPNLFSYIENKNGLATLHDKDVNKVYIFDMKNKWCLLNKTEHKDSFDLLCSLVPEDLLICSVDDKENDYISYAHLMSPSDWSAQWAFRKSFVQLHEKILNNKEKQVIKDPKKIIKAIISTNTLYQRVGAISFRSSNALDRRPESGHNDYWDFGQEQNLLLRFERQTVVSFPEIKSFLFTVRTYYNDLTNPNRIGPTIKAIAKYNDGAYHSKFILENQSKILQFLMKRRNV